MTTLSVTSAIIRRGDEIVMVQQPDEDGLYWFIPGGVIEPHELIVDALRREIQEETGLIVGEVGSLAYVTQTYDVALQRKIVAHVFEVSDITGQCAPDDPDGEIQRVEWVPISEAINRLERCIWDSMREPPQQYLSGKVADATVWQYRQHRERRFELVSRIP